MTDLEEQILLNNPSKEVDKEDGDDPYLYGNIQKIRIKAWICWCGARINIKSCGKLKSGKVEAQRGSHMDQKVLSVTALTHPVSRWRCPLRMTQSVRFQKSRMNRGLQRGECHGCGPWQVVRDPASLLSFWILGKVRLVYLRWLRPLHLGSGVNPQWRCWRPSDGDSTLPCRWPRGSEFPI